MFLVQVLVVFIFCLVLYDWWKDPPLAIRFKARIIYCVMFSLFVAAVVLITVCEFMIAIEGFSVYLVIPVLSLPTLACAAFYSIRHLNGIWW